MQRESFEVDSSEAGQRIDQLISRRLGSLGRKRTRELCEAGHVRMDGRIARKGDRARAGAQIIVELVPGAEALPDEERPLRVMQENEHWVIVDKPAGEASVAKAGHGRGSTASALLARYPEMGSVGDPREAGLIHRLDAGTSGLIVAARTTRAHAALRRALSAEQLTKRYLALVLERDLPGAGIIDEPLAPHPKSRRRVAVVKVGHPRARPATTHWQLVERGPRYAVIEVTAHRAYRHQIRAHLAWLGFPIVGDPLYGGATEPSIAGRHGLHASYIAWAGAEGIVGFEATLRLPDDLSDLLRGGGSVS